MHQWNLTTACRVLHDQGKRFSKYQTSFQSNNNWLLICHQIVCTGNFSFPCRMEENVEISEFLLGLKFQFSLCYSSTLLALSVVICPWVYSTKCQFSFKTSSSWMFHLELIPWITRVKRPSLHLYLWSGIFSALPFCLYTFLLSLTIFIWDSGRTNEIRGETTGKWNHLILSDKTLGEKSSVCLK